MKIIGLRSGALRTRLLHKRMLKSDTVVGQMAAG
jgi:hypothetical protein